MKLKYILEKVENRVKKAIKVSKNLDLDLVEVSSVEYDSRQVKKNSLFVCIPGLDNDGHDFIEEAIKRGARAVVVDQIRETDFINSVCFQEVCLLVTFNPRLALSALSAVFYNYPSRAMEIVGVTGTNGKTSVTYMLESIFKAYLKALGDFSAVGVIGTINYRWGEIKKTASNTTPESKDLQKILSEMREDRVRFVILEVSSHALELERVADLDFDTIIFTNLTQDHLDFHQSFANYFQAKKKIFALLEKSCKKNRAALVNLDDLYGQKIYLEKDKFSYPLISFALNEKAFFSPQKETIDNSLDGLSYVLEKPINDFRVKLKLIGKFHIYNSLAALGASYLMGISPKFIQEGLVNLKKIPGRFEILKSESGFFVIIDYAHTSDALLKLLTSLKEWQPRRIITIFGCGGDRDKSKRSLMGEVASQNSDYLIITNDNPRSEDPAEIVEDIQKGIKGEDYEILLDRELAIKKAISEAESGDILVIAGKGHEDYQIFGNQVNHFDDHEMASKYLEENLGA